MFQDMMYQVKNERLEYQMQEDQQKHLRIYMLNTVISNRQKEYLPSFLLVLLDASINSTATRRGQHSPQRRRKKKNDLI
jgi:hypothetical protein